MRARPEVRRRVTTPRRVAAADVSARETETELHPALPETEALRAALGARVHVAHQLQVRTPDLRCTRGGCARRCSLDGDRGGERTCCREERCQHGSPPERRDQRLAPSLLARSVLGGGRTCPPAAV